jgi:hypothetical protein
MNLIANPKYLYDELMKLVQQRLVHIRFNDDQTLVMFKYTREVFYKNLWHVSPALREARGIVFTNPDKTGRCEIAALPFTKVFNIGENGVTLKVDEVYDVFNKINGFMATLSRNPITGKALITTTGSFDSPYVAMAEEKLDIKNGENLPPWFDGHYSAMYEIVHANDPHIVSEQIGAHLLAHRDIIGDEAGVLKNNIELYLGPMTGADIMRVADGSEREGFMIYNDDLGFAAKLKTRYYRTKKFLMRVKGDKLRLIWDHLEGAKLAFSDEEFWPIFQKLRVATTADEFIALSEQDRRAFLESLE